LIAYLEQHQKTCWGSLPRLSRTFNPVGVIEALRRSGQTLEPEFLALYQARKSASRAQLFAIIMALALIGIVPIGTALWGWSW
jgi:hypothetical protein